MSNWFKRLAPLAVLTLGATLSGCSYSVDWGEVSGVPLAELDMSGDPPTNIQLAGPDRIEITEGTGLDITVEGDADAGDALRFDRDGNRLTIARDSDIYDGRGKAIVRIQMPAPSTLGIAGSGEIGSATVAETAELEIAGNGEIKVASVTSERLQVEIAGSGDVEAKGTAQKLTVEIAGSGNVNLEELVADDVEVEIAGSGDVVVASDGRVSADIAGSGNVRVIGSASCSVDAAGSGSLTCRPADSASAAPADEETAD